MPFQSEAHAAGYLAAIIDGEGTVTLPQTSIGKRTCFAIRIANTDWDIIVATTEALELLHIAYRVHQRTFKGRPVHWRTGWDVVIGTRSGLKRLAQTVELRSTKRIERLRTLLASYKHTEKPSQEELRNLYLVEKRSCTDLMRHFGAKSSGTIHKWLKAYGIERRSLSEAVLLDWQKRKKLHAV